MITITGYKDGVAIKGHAYYATPGHDIVCAAISAAFQSLISSIEQLTEDKITYGLASGDSYIRYRSLSEESNLLLRSFFITVKDIADAYPECVAVLEYDGNGSGDERSGAERKDNV